MHHQELKKKYITKTIFSTALGLWLVLKKAYTFLLISQSLFSLGPFEFLNIASESTDLLAFLMRVVKGNLTSPTASLVKIGIKK